MLCFRDRTFCINPKCTCPPDRRLTNEVEAEAHAWWEEIRPGHGQEAPICVGDVCQGNAEVAADAINGIRNDLADIAAGYVPGTLTHKVH